MKCKFAQFLFRAFGITGGALAVLFVIYYKCLRWMPEIKQA